MIAPAITVAALTIAGLGGAIPALAAPVSGARPVAVAADAALPAQCTQSGSTDTCTFTTRGETEFTVPPNVGSIQVTSVGGHGGTSLSGTPGGLGAVASGTVSVTAGENLFLEVNVLGGTAGRDNGIVDGGSGGGESDVRTCGATATCSSGTTLTSRLIVAGGGGGGGSDDGQGHGGNAGTTGNAANGSAGAGGFANAGPGLGGTTTAAGTGGASCGDGGSNGSAGATAGGAGGAGGNSNSTPGNSGGGGGAGEFGGGGGGGCARAVDFAGSGGGGTSFAAASVASPSFAQATASQAAAVTLVFTAPFEVTTASLPDGTVEDAYDQSVAAANGTTPYSWQLDGGALPDGLKLTSAGAITGIPTAGGTFTFTVEATDSGSLAQTATAQLSITIDQADPADFVMSASPGFDATVATPVTLTASITGLPGVAAPTGTVSFTLDGQPAACNPVTISGGQAQCSLGDLSAGSHNFTAAYSGDTNYNRATAGLFLYPVSQLTSSETITAQPPSPSVGQGVTFTATVTANGSPVSGGTVQWLVDGSDSGSPVPVTSDGTATLGPVTGLSVGQHTIEADYSGSDQDTATSVQTNITIGHATPAVELSAAPASNATVATPVTLTATLVGVAGVAAPTGSVAFTVDGQAASCGTVTISGSTAQCALGDLAAGSHDFGASYGGDTNYTTATGSLSGYSVAKLTTMQTITSTVTSPVFGQPVSFTTTVTTGGSPVTAGSVQWLVDGADSGSPVTVGSDGTASFGPISDLSVGQHTIEADYSGSDQDSATTDQLDVVVGVALTATTIKVTASALYATVTAVAPGAGGPAGSVTFTVAGTTAGTVKLSPSGTARLAFKSSGAETASASYSGDASFAPSSAATATKNPKITATLSSARPKTKFGWYRSPVKITFSCTPGSAPLTGPCPAPVTLSRSAAAQMVSRTIHGQDGGIATVVVSPVNIDQVPPQVKVTGARNGEAADAPGPANLACAATDKLSGLAAPCKLVVHRTEQALTWTATATDRAGNTSTARGKVHLIDYFVAAVPRVAGRFVVTAGKFYTVEAFILSATKAPEYVFAAPAGERPHPVGPAMTRIGPHLWAIRIHITEAMAERYKFWTLGVQSGQTLHTVPITLKR
jgi:hypothetical protein